jgi:TPP-dependent pyruvate/acetoin dehydrogenase alpha subunit
MASERLKLTEQMFRALYRIRRVEEKIAQIYPSDKIKSPVHLSIGQESVAVGVCAALQPCDIVFGTYRGHAMYLAKGGDLKGMIAELYGKVTGCAKGKGGSMHLIDKDKGVMGTSAIVGTTIPVSVGYAMGLKYRGSDAIVASFFGDGAVDEGAFHEGINFAALKKVPIIFVCENNEYAIHSHHLKRRLSDNLCERAKSYGIYTRRIDDGDVFKIYRFVKKYSMLIRSGQVGPVFLECMTSRWREHVGPNEDFDFGYRTRGDIDHWLLIDPVQRLKSLLPDPIADQIIGEAEMEIEEAFQFAEESPFPEGVELDKDLFREV